MFTKNDVIYSYTREQAIEDGVLVDVSEMAKEAGIKYPMAITTRVHGILEAYLANGQSYDGRLWDLLTMLKVAIHRGRGGGRIDFETLFLMPNIVKMPGGSHKTGCSRKHIKMWSRCHGGDNAEPVITVMMPDED